MSGASLFEVEDDIQALLETADMVAPGLDAEFQLALSNKLKESKTKVDGVAWRLKDWEADVKKCKSAAKELAAFQAATQAKIDRLERYVSLVIQQRTTNAKGQYPALEGHTSAMKLKRNPNSLEITDEAAIPAMYKTLTITINAGAWEDFLQEMDPIARGYIADAIDKAECKVQISEIKKTIPAAAELNQITDGILDFPGVCWSPKSYRLEVS